MTRTIPFKYKWGNNYDDYLPQIVETAKMRVNNNDDYRLLIVGDTGTGKSMLMLWLYDLYAGEEAEIGCVGLNEDGYRKAVHTTNQLQKKGNTFVACVYDEANIYSTEVMTTFNKEIMKLLGEIRGKRWFHIWAMPNPGRFQQDFIDETFDALIYIYTKDKDKPRMYYFFDRNSINTMRHKEGSGQSKARLSLDFLERKAKKYAVFRGCFKEYKGILRADYNLLKENKMDERITMFSQVGEGFKYKSSDVARLLGVNPIWVTQKTLAAVESGDMVPDLHFNVNAAGNRRYSEEGVVFLKQYSFNTIKVKKKLVLPKDCKQN